MNFIISFPSGASGRFITNIVTCLMYDLSPNIIYGDKNHAHDWSHESAYSFDCDRNIDDLRDSRIYQSLTFTNKFQHNFFWTHAFPDFKEIDNIPDTKLIIISYDDSSKREISYNSYFKNSHNKHNYVNPKFKHDNIIVPDYISNKTLLIKYRDIFNMSFLNILADFTNTRPNQATINNFSNYLDGQVELINNL